MEESIRRGADPNTRDRNGATAVMYAAWSGDEKSVALLMSAGSDAGIIDKNGRSLLMYASAGCGEEFIKKLISMGLDVNTADDTGRTPLMFASLYGNTESAGVLLEHGADPNARDCSGRPPVSMVAGKDSMGTLRLLVERGANVDLADSGGKTPLMHMAETGRWGEAKYILSAGADVNAQDMLGRTALMYASAGCRGWHDEIVRLLVSAGADINTRGKDGETALSLACLSGTMESVDFLLSREADGTWTDSKGRTLPERAGLAGRLGTLSLLARRVGFSGTDMLRFATSLKESKTLTTDVRGAVALIVSAYTPPSLCSEFNRKLSRSRAYGFRLFLSVSDNPIVPERLLIAEMTRGRKGAPIPLSEIQARRLILFLLSVIDEEPGLVADFIRKRTPDGPEEWRKKDIEGADKLVGRLSAYLRQKNGTGAELEFETGW